MARLILLSCEAGEVAAKPTEGADRAPSPAEPVRRRSRRGRPGRPPLGCELRSDRVPPAKRPGVRRARVDRPCCGPSRRLRRRDRQPRRRNRAPRDLGDAGVSNGVSLRCGCVTSAKDTSREVSFHGEGFARCRGCGRRFSCRKLSALRSPSTSFAGPLPRFAGEEKSYRPPGASLKGTSLSTRMSPGRPSTRSAMMFFRISSVPPAMRSPGAHMADC